MEHYNTSQTVDLSKSIVQYHCHMISARAPGVRYSQSEGDGGRQGS